VVYVLIKRANRYLIWKENLLN